MKIPVALLFVPMILHAAGAFASPLADDDYRRTLQRTPNAENGAQLFQTCARCHHADGFGQADSWVPRIGGERYEVIVHELIDYRHGQRWDERMQANSAEHHLADLQAVADVASYASRLEPPPPPRGDEGQYGALGRQVYAAQCARCHGAHGEGRANAPRLAGQHYAYLVRQMHDIVEGRRAHIPDAHIRRLEPLDFREIEGVADALSRAAE